MAISDRIKAEARRTIDGMTRFYEKFSDDADDAEELEHRIARIEASLEGCNGLSHDDKIQKTAENVFELTCAQERSYDALRMELRKSREEYKGEFLEMKKLNSEDFETLQKEIRDGLANVVKKIEDSGMDSSGSCKEGQSDDKHMKSLAKIVSDHPVMALNSFLFLLVLVFISGHFDDILRLFSKG